MVLLWVGVVVAIIVGILLLCITELLAPFVPVLIGLGVAGIVMILMKVFGSATEASNDSKPDPTAGDKPAPARPAVSPQGNRGESRRLSGSEGPGLLLEFHPAAPTGHTAPTRSSWSMAGG